MSRARTEETLAAELSRLRATTGSSTEASLATLSAAVALRPYAQERAWLPGDDGPSLLEIQSRLGLAGLTFDTRVPAAWRPYYSRMLDEVVADLTIVFPRLDLVGLHVHFGESPLRDRALALHDPSTRTIYFPLATSAGAMAHELAHDLDWQAARKRYGVRGGYRTDRSVRQYRDGLAASVRRMASAGRPEREGSSSDSPSMSVSERPTEAFARGVDWFVATTLASRGRMNGYLSAVQDEVITGYASATAPRGGVSEGDATLDAIIEIAQVNPAMLAWYDAKYGTGRRFGVAEAVGRVLIAPLTRVDMRGSVPNFDGMNANIRALRSSPEASSGWDCLLDSPAMRGRDAEVVRSAMTFAAGERAHGLVTRWGDYARGQPDATWRFRALGGAPWSPSLADSTWREVRDALLWRAARIDDGHSGLDLTERAERRAAWEACARR